MREKLTLILMGIIFSFVAAAQYNHEEIKKGAFGENQRVLLANTTRETPQDFNLFSKVVHSKKRDNGLIPKHEGRTAQGLLEEFVEHLRSFLNETTFDFLGFEVHHVGLRENLTDIQSSIDDLWLQLKFVENMFQVMLGSVQSLKHYKVPPDRGVKYLKKIIEINVSALALYNSHGVPDFESEEKLFLFWRGIAFWSKKFEDLEDISADLKQAFEYQVGQAKKTLSSLQNHLPPKEQI
ncbi:hypothetical protein JCM33374_g1764 [Metschnikowia sp. JCM 33374]|nr:hypothetical protein JCM33374_g1764 [Metschnikowia sp. JCM 33374]